MLPCSRVRTQLLLLPGGDLEVEPGLRQYKPHFITPSCTFTFYPCPGSTQAPSMMSAKPEGHLHPAPATVAHLCPAWTGWGPAPQPRPVSAAPCSDSALPSPQQKQQKGKAAPTQSPRLTSTPPCPHSAIPLPRTLATTFPLSLITTGNSTPSHSPSSWDKLAAAKSFGIFPARTLC